MTDIIAKIRTADGVEHDIPMMQTWPVRIGRPYSCLLYTSQADVQRLGQDFVNLLNQALQRAGRRAEVTLAHERTDIAGGCVVCSGGMEVDCSHQALLRAVREKTEGEINHMLFAQEG